MRYEEGNTHAHAHILRYGHALRGGARPEHERLPAINHGVHRYHPLPYTHTYEHMGECRRWAVTLGRGMGGDFG